MAGDGDPPGDDPVDDGAVGDDPVDDGAVDDDAVTPVRRDAARAASDREPGAKLPPPGGAMGREQQRGELSRLHEVAP